MEEDLKILKKEKRKKIWPIICIVLVILLLAGGGYYYYTNYYQKDEPKEVDTKVSLKDNFYDSINYKNNKSIQEAQSVIINKEIATIQQIENDPNFKDEDYKNFIKLYEDQEERDKRGLEELKPYFDAIDNADTLDKFSDIVVKVSYDLGVSSFINFGIDADYYDNSKNVIAIVPMTLEKLGTFTIIDPMVQNGLEYFTDEKYSLYKKEFEKARIEYFKEYGYDEEKATNLSNEITNFAKTIQASSKSIDNLQNHPVENYKSITKSELKTLMSNLPLDKLLAKYNLSNYPYFAITDEGHLKELNNYYKEENLPLMKEILKLLILEDVASYYTTSNYARIVANTHTSLVGEQLNYQVVTYIYENLILKPALLDSTLNTKYEELYFTQADKQEITELVNKIKIQYKETINNADWLDDSTKQEAIKKIDNMKLNVGYTKGNDKAKSKIVSKENGGSLLSNYITMTKDDSNQISKIIKNYKLEIPQFEVNAFYYPNNNSINFPAGFKEFYDGVESKYAKYAYMGMIIGHEISHAFDSNGSQFDEKGNVKNWWTENDKNTYKTKEKKIIDYYSQYEVFGIKVNGEITVAENIADLAGVKAIIKVMESENATNDDYKEFFESYAKLWNNTATKEELEINMISDNHSPAQVRVNAVLSSMDKFYEVYDIKEGDKMYVAKENRVGLW